MLSLTEDDINQQTAIWKRPSSFFLGLCTLLCIVFFADSIWATENSGNIANAPKGYTLSIGEHFINTKDGVVKGERGSVPTPSVGVDASKSGENAIIENYGMISAQNDLQAIGVRLNDGTLKNYGTIKAISYPGSNLLGPVGIDSKHATIYNYGTIEQPDAALVVMGIRLNNAVLHNRGKILTPQAIEVIGNSKVYLEAGTDIIRAGLVVADTLGQAELYLDGSGTINFSMAGNWKSLQKTGTGVWVMDMHLNDAIPTTFGSLTISQGTLALGDSSFDRSIQKLIVNSGATLDLGTQTLFAPNCTFMPNSTIKFRLPLKGHGVLVAQDVTMGDNVVILPTNIESAEGITYTLIEGTEASSYAGATLSNKQNKISTLFSYYELIKESNKLSLKVDKVSDEELAQKGLNVTDARAVESAFQNDSVSMNKLSGMSIEKVKDALKQAHAEPISEVISAVRDAGYAAQGVITRRLITARSAALASNESTGLSSGSDELSWKIWGQGFGSVSSETAHNDSNGYDANTTGLTFGVDKALVENFRLGLAYSYIFTDVDSKSSSNNNEVDSNLLTVYCETLFGDDMYLDAHISYGFNNYKAKRYMTELGLQAKADFDGSTFNIGGEFGKSFNFTSNPITITPYVGLDYSYISIDSYKESGAGSSNLIVDDTYNNVFTSTLGARFGATFNAFKPEMHAAWVHDWAQEEISTNAEFANSGAALSSSAVSNDPDKINLGLGLGWQVSDVVTLDLTADYLGSAHMDSWGGTVKMSYEF
ncbi:autotransporter outer membrane beta-barrel domain-containing protein [Halodesulfovibrio aestuarii]|uniref:autotransporter family protein n=3 Tax=Halodesulfovibrio aestuarii TaxID=126333 RepID=UPI003D324A0A